MVGTHLTGHFDPLLFCNTDHQDLGWVGEGGGKEGGAEGGRGRRGGGGVEEGNGNPMTIYHLTITCQSSEEHATVT